MKNYKTVLVSAAIYSVVFGLIFVTLSVLSLLVRRCSIEMTGSPLVYMMFLLYFRVKECKTVLNFPLLDITTDVTANIPDETQAVYRTYIFTLIYVGLYGALIFTSLYALVGINNSCMGKKSFPVFFVPWILVCFAILAMDVTATTFYIMDTIKAMHIKGLVELLEIRNADAVIPVFEEQLGILVRYLPPVIMFLTTSKFFVFLIMDIVIITLIIKAGWAAATYHKYVDDTIRQYSQNLSRTNPAFENSQSDITAQKQQTKVIPLNGDQNSIHELPARAESVAQPETPIRYNDTSPQPFVYAYKKHDYKPPQENNNTAPRPTSLDVQPKNVERPASQALPNNQRYDDSELEKRLSHYSSSNGNVVRTLEPLKQESNQEKHHAQTRVRVLPMVAELNRNSSEAKQRPPVPPKPYNPNRISQNPSFIGDVRRSDQPENRLSALKGDPVQRNSSMNNPEEIRGQFPWSYFKARDDMPKKAFTDLKEDEELPRVPIPDYTLHFPKTKRANLNSDSDGDDSWNRFDQNQRY